MSWLPPFVMISVLYLKGQSIIQAQMYISNAIQRITCVVKGAKREHVQNLLLYKGTFLSSLYLQHNKPQQNLVHFSWCMQNQKLKKNIYRSDVQVSSELYRSFIPIKLSLLFSITQWISNPPSKAVPGKFYGCGGHSKRKCLQDRSNFNGSQAWQILPILNNA